MASDKLPSSSITYFPPPSLNVKHQSQNAHKCLIKTGKCNNSSQGNWDKSCFSPKLLLCTRRTHCGQKVEQLLSEVVLDQDGSYLPEDLEPDVTKKKKRHHNASSIVSPFVASTLTLCRVAPADRHQPPSSPSRRSWHFSEHLSIQSSPVVPKGLFTVPATTTAASFFFFVLLFFQLNLQATEQHYRSVGRVLYMSISFVWFLLFIFPKISVKEEEHLTRTELAELDALNQAVLFLFFSP